MSRVLSDGVQITTMPTDVLRDLFCTMHGVPVPEGSTPLPQVQALYDGVCRELAARIAADAETRKPGYHYEGVTHDGKKWLIILKGLPSTPEPVVIEGTLQEACKFANQAADDAAASSYIVLPMMIAAEAKR